MKGELSQLRTGRVTPSILDDIVVDAYGTDLSVKEVGTITVLDPQTIQIAPWDKNLLESISTAIQKSDLKLNPSIRSDSVIVPVPALTEERRKEYTRLVASKVEETKQTMRNFRQDAMKSIETRFSNKEFGEDQKFKLKEDFEELVKEYISKTTEMGESKNKEIMGS